MRDGIRSNPANPAADFSHPSMRTWLSGLGHGSGKGASFETRIWWSPGSAAKKIAEGLCDAGYACSGKGTAFIVTGRYGPLKDGEIERAHAWGAELARSLA
jgi:hypothetical protein